MQAIRKKAYAKINIGLDVTGRRADGYHTVKMIMQTIDLYDEIVVRKQPRDITIKTNKPFIPCDARNLAYKAAEAVKNACGIFEGVRIDIGKQIPVAAGLAGGSADAAAVICAMNELFDLGLSGEAMDEIALGIGADVPFCLRRGTYLAEGIGEELTKLPDMPPCFCLLVNPNFGISTKKVYEAFDELANPVHPDIDGTIHALGRKDAPSVALAMGNVLEQAVLPMYPKLLPIKEELKAHGAMGAMMSGSGPTVFGLFEQEEALWGAYQAFKGAGYGTFKVEF